MNKSCAPLASSALWAGVTILAQACGAAESPTEGKQVFDRWCADCHAPVSAHRQMLPGTYALQNLYKGVKPAALEQRRDLSKPFIKVIVRTGRNVMPATRKTEISDEQLDALSNYLANHVP